MGSAAKRLAVLTALALFLTPATSWSEEASVIGTWRLKSFVRQIVGTAESYNQLGEHPSGFISYSPDGRMNVIFVTGDRVRPVGSSATEEDRIKLYNSMIAYAGTYTIDGNKVVHHVDISWNGTYTGTDQVRYFTIEDGTLTIKTEINKSPIDGRQGVGILVFEKVK
jgi:hypothetical protein